MPIFRRIVVDLFHVLYYGSDRRHGSWRQVTWMGFPVLKCPFDLWLYQEIIHEVRPDKIIESGTFRGGNTLYMASLCDLIYRGEIISIDKQLLENLPQHPRITYLQGSSVDRSMVIKVRARINPGDKIMVILDSNHEKSHVLQEMNLYAQFVSPGSYLIVEDTNINGHPVFRNFGPGPMEAVREFLRHNNQFVIDKEREKHLLTFNQCGYLKRVD